MCTMLILIQPKIYEFLVYCTLTTVRMWWEIFSSSVRVHLDMVTCRIVYQRCLQHIKRFNIWQVNLEKESLEAGEPGEAVPVQAEAAEGGDHVQVEALPGQVQLLVTYYNIYNSAEGGDHAQVETLPGQVQLLVTNYNIYI